MIDAKNPCPLNLKRGEFICVDGQIWALSYSEMGPPGQRQHWGPCAHCKTGESND